MPKWDEGGHQEIARAGEEEDATRSSSRGRRSRKSKRRSRDSSSDEHSDYQSDFSESDESSDESDRRADRKKHRRPSRSHTRTRSRRHRRRHSSDDESSSYESEDSESGSENGSERAGRRRREKRRKREDKKRSKRDKDKEERRDRKKKNKGKKKKSKESDLAKKGAVTNSWGKYGIIKEVDMWNKRPEFTAWLAEVKQINLEALSMFEEKKMFKEFMEDHNTATFPSKKYYDLDAYHRRMMIKEQKKGSKSTVRAERTVFNDEEQRRQELMVERERQKAEQVDALKHSMQTGMAQAMREQVRLREEMMYQYKLGNFEAAAAIQKRLDPDAPM